MSGHHPNKSTEHSMCDEFREAVEDKQFKVYEDICEFYFQQKGINARFLPLERETQYPSIVKKTPENYSVAVSTRDCCKLRCCAVALFIIEMELSTPGFFGKYIKKPQIVDMKPHSSEVLHLQCMLEEMQAA